MPTSHRYRLTCFHYAPQCITAFPLRCFASLPENNDGTVSLQSESIQPGTIKADKKSLHQTIHYLLNKIPVGRMNEVNLKNARSFIFIVAKWKNEQGAKLAEALLERMHSEQSTRATVDTEMYNACMNAWNTSGADGKTIVHAVEGIFTRMEQRYKDKSNRHALMARPDRTSYNCLLNCYSKCDEDHSFKVHAILEKMKDIASCKDDSEYAIEIQPDEITYNSLMNYYASRTNQHYAAQQAEDILLQMSDLTQQPDSNVQLDSTSFNIAIKGWSNAGLGLDGAERAKSLLFMMMKWHNKGYPNVEPTAVTFSTAIDAFTKVSSEDAETAVRNSMELLDRMEASSITDLDHINSCYNAAANVLIKMGVENAGERVKELMLRMKNMDAVPDEMMYRRCIEAYVKDGSEDGFRAADALLNDMADNLNSNPSSVTFNSLLGAAVKKNTNRSMEFAEKLLGRMEALGGDSRPDTASYNMIIGALSRNSSPGSEQKAVDYLRKMLRSYNTEHYLKARPNSFVFNCIISMLDRSDEEWVADVMYKTLKSMENLQRKGNTTVLPDTITYNTVISKLARKPTKDNAKKVMKLLAQMEGNEESGNEGAAPDIITYSNVLRLQGKLDPNRAATIASTYLKRVLSKKNLPPIDKIGLRVLLLALSKCGKYEDASVALRTWERIESCNKKSSEVLDSDLCNLVLMSLDSAKSEESAAAALSFVSERFRRLQGNDNTVIFPTLIGMNATLTNLARSGRINDAFSIIELMKKFGKKNHMCMQPDAACYRSVLAALSDRHSSTKHNAVYAEKFLKKAQDDLGELDISMFNAAINACAWTTGDEPVRADAIRIAFGIFQQTKDTQSHDPITFGLMIKACMHLSNNDASRFKSVQVCCNCFNYSCCFMKAAFSTFLSGYLSIVQREEWSVTWC